MCIKDKKWLLTAAGKQYFSHKLLKASFINAITIGVSIGITLIFVNVSLALFYVLPNKLPRLPSTGSNVIGGKIYTNQYEFKTTHSYNSNGFREVELNTINLSKDKNRIVFLGDSFAEGWGVEEIDRISNLTISHLNSAKKKYIGINLGQLASGPAAYYLNLIDYGVALKPNLVVLTFFSGNDFMYGHTTKFNPDVKVTYNLEAFFGLPFSNFFTKINLNYIGGLYEEVVQKKQFLVRRKHYDNYWEAYYQENINEDYILKKLKIDSKTLFKYLKNFEPWFVEASFNGSINPGNLITGVNNLTNTKQSVERYYKKSDYDNVVELVLETKKIANRNQSDFVILLIPSIYDVQNQGFTQHLRENLKYTSFDSRFEEAKVLKDDFVNEMNVHGVDIIDLTKLYLDQKIDVYYTIDGHLNKLGHKLAAKALTDYIKSKE